MTIFALDWNKEGYLAIGSTDLCCQIMLYDPQSKTFEEHARVSLTTSCRCISFSPINPSMLAIGLFNGSILIYDIKLGEVKKVLKGSSARILCIAWHPQFEYMLATGGFDHMVRIHDTQNNGQKELGFHTDRVRSVAWNTELPWLLTSGGDDSQQAIWDIRNRQLLFHTEEPTLAMTSLTAHSMRPFSYFSSHFDASIIQWSLMSIPDIALAQLKSLLKLPEEELLAEPHAIMVSDIKARLTGTSSTNLFKKLANAGDLDRCEKVLRFFQGLDGQEEFWAMTRIMKGDGPSLDSENLRVHHISDVTAAYSSKAQQLIQANPMSMLGTALAKKEDRLQEAARLNLVSGNFQQYCEIQM